MMTALRLREIIEATGGRVFNGDPGDIFFTGVSIDSRTIKKGDLFVPIKGCRFDGHDFLRDALKTGAGALVSALPSEPVKGRPLVYVRNTLGALQDIARYLRKKSRAVLIGVTGTNGKTTTKELIAAILGLRHRVLKNSGNLNNHIGMPLSLININENDEFAVMEMGASIKGDISLLCEIAVPDCGVITNVGPAHLEGFGNLDMVRSTKLELYEAVKTIALNSDDGFLMGGIAGRQGKDIVLFGIDNKADVFAKDILLQDKYSVFTLCLGSDRRAAVRMNMPGRFNIYNALAAASVCSALGADMGDIREGIESFAGVPMRLEVRDLFGSTVISDVYNANPDSMEEAIKELVRLKRQRAIAVLGDMLELGSYSEEAHRRLGRWMSDLNVDMLIAVGPMMAITAEEFSAKGGRSVKVSDALEARRVLLDICSSSDTVLVKGSRSMSMENVLNIKDDSRGHPALCSRPGVTNVL